MTVEELVTGLEATGLEVAYYQYPENEAPEPPYLIYYFPNSADFIADGINYQDINALNVELYTNNKDFAAEALVEQALNDMGLAYTRSEQYITSEKMYEVLFQTEVLING